ncbi:HD-GYP domain-containing protein [Robertmurraya andreesenii]|uniref:HD-GYP domain-containing protein (C-di-GMP phosphodiesterase class II) n=1 Tax=Anoxybacillus andreesenii TaxID=1325932 RepID=A0ABT9V303_9BACL|nr:HD-GYP domain-containing protein [Robertmurraya andreesenii]MDQ0155297.1 HD-GYP domain-containing protein (c-di-GMP phosphodiesterase class II) [Robertmurraya andreesenii]
MRYVATDTVKPGTILARTIYNDKGQVLLSEGVALKEELLMRLLEIGIPYIYVKDGKTDDICYKEVVPRALKTKAIKSIEGTFQQIDLDSTIPSAIVIEKATKKFTALVRELHSQIKNNEDLLSLLSDVYTYDNYIFTHSFNVTLYSLAIGMELGLSEKELETLGLGAVLHDVGKMKIPTEILFKPGKLTEEEFGEIKKHPQDGFDILRNVQTLSLIVAHCAYQHHERLNGSGYPRKLKGNEIHYFAKIIAVADVFDAVTSDRIYRGAMLPHNGLEILFAGAGPLFEREIVQAFRRAVAIYPVGLTVELSDGRKGVVSAQNSHMSDRPIIRVLEENGEEVTPYELDLLQEISVVITGCDTTFHQKDSRK